VNAPHVTALVVTYQTGPRLKECLYALAAAPDIAASVIVDNGNPAAMREWLDRFVGARPDFTLLRPGENLGFGAAVNLAVKSAGTAQLLVINPDAVIRWGSIGAMQDTAKGLREPWIVGGRIFDLQGREERGARRRELTLWRAMTRVIGWNTWTMEGDPAPSSAIEIPVISGAFFLTSAASFAQLGGFDEGYFLHVEDIDLCRRCREAGGTVMYDPRAGALHYGATSDAPSKIVAGHKADSLERYFKRNAKGWFERACVAALMPLIKLATRLRA